MNEIEALDLETLKRGKAAAYAERDQLVAHLSKIYPSHMARHPKEEPWEDDWRWIVCVHGPTGQMTWHIHDSELPWFKHLYGNDLTAIQIYIDGIGRMEPVSDWDGHDTVEKYRRLEAIPIMKSKKGGKKP